MAPEWNTFMRICDAVNANPTRVKPILAPLVKRLQAKDINTLLLSLELLDSVVKNCPPSYAYIGSSEVQSVLLKLATTKKVNLLFRFSLFSFRLGIKCVKLIRCVCYSSK